MRNSRIRLKLTVPLIALALAVAGCSSSGGSDSKSTPALRGAPIKLMVIAGIAGQLSSNPEAPAGAKAAADAINAKGGIPVPGGPARPLQIIVCDDRNDPNAAADCGHKAVTEQVLASVGNMSLVGGSYMPILSKAGIPAIADYPISQAELTDPLSFPIVNPIVTSVSPSMVAKSLGAPSLKTVLLDTPATTGFIPQLTAFAKTMSLDASQILIPPAATDYASFAAKAANGNSAIQFAMNGAQSAKMVNGLISQGVDLQKRTVIEPGDFVTHDQLSQGAFNGVYMVGLSWPATYTDNPGVKQYNDELDQAGDKKTARNGIGIESWAGVHIVADLLAKASAINSTELVRLARSAGPISFAPLVPFDWSKPSPSSGLLAGTHAYSTGIMVNRVQNGKQVPVVSDFVPFDKTFSIAK